MVDGDTPVQVKLRLPWRVVQDLKREALERSEPGAEVTLSTLVLEALLRRVVFTDHDTPTAKKAAAKPTTSKKESSK